MLKSVRVFVRATSTAVLAFVVMAATSAAAPTTAAACTGGDCLRHCECLTECRLLFPEEGAPLLACFQSCHDMYPCTSMPCGWPVK